MLRAKFRVGESEGEGAYAQDLTSIVGCHVDSCELLEGVDGDGEHRAISELREGISTMYASAT